MKRVNKKEILEEIYAPTEVSGRRSAKPASETIKKMEVPIPEVPGESLSLASGVNEFDEFARQQPKQLGGSVSSGMDHGQEEPSHFMQRPEQYESKVWLIVTVLAILLLIVIALGLGFLVFL